MSSTLKVGLIGLGGIANTHVPGWVASPHTEIIAGSDVRPEVFDTWKEKYGVSRFYENFNDLIADPDVDIVDICTPNMFHAPADHRRAPGGQARSLRKTARAHPGRGPPDDRRARSGGRLLMTAQHFRYRGVSLAVKAEIQSGALGDIYHARAWMLRRSGLPLSPTFHLQDAIPAADRVSISACTSSIPTLWLMGHPKPVAVSGVARTRWPTTPAPSPAGGASQSPRTSTSRISPPPSCALTPARR